MASAEPEKDKSKVHKLSLKGSAKLVAEFVSLLHLRRSGMRHNEGSSLTTRLFADNSSNTRSTPSCPCSLALRLPA